MLHQYIGARYVPLFYRNSLDPTSTDWEPNVIYEPLTVVTADNQHSYISKKTVPASVGSPALNAEYWLDTGSFNAYIEDLQNQINDISLELDKSIRQDEIVWIGDSYVGAASLQPSERQYRFSTLVSNRLGLTERNYAVGGTGLFPDSPYNPTGHNFYQQAVDAYDDYIANHRDVNKVKYFVVAGGRNDISTNPSATVSDFESYINTLATYIKLHFPYAQLVAIPYLWDSTDITDTGLEQYRYCVQCYSMAAFAVMEDAYTCLSGYGNYIGSDNVHPTVYGHNTIALRVFAWFKGSKYHNEFLRLLYPHEDYLDQSEYFGYIETLAPNIFHLKAEFNLTTTINTGIVALHTRSINRYQNVPPLTGVVHFPVIHEGSANTIIRGFGQWINPSGGAQFQLGITGLNPPTGKYTVDFVTNIGHR